MRLKLLSISLLFITFSSGFSREPFYGILSVMYQPGNTETKFIVGLKGGLNFSQPVPLKRYSIFNNTDGSNDKQYNPLFRNPGYQYSFVGLYNLNDNFFVTFQPGVSTFNYTYKNSYFWTDNSNPDNQVELTNTSHQKLRYFEFPLFIGYQYGGGALKPFIQGGVGYSLMQYANATVKSDLLEHSLSGEMLLNTGDNTGDVTSSFIRSRIFLAFGGGASLDMSAIILVMDVNYYLGLNNIVNESTRYDNQTFASGSYDISDDLQLHNLLINIGILFPLNKSARQKGISCKQLFRK